MSVHGSSDARALDPEGLFWPKGSSVGASVYVREADMVALIDMVHAMAQRPEKEPGLSSCIWEVRDIAHVIHGARRERFTWDIAHRFVETSPTLMRLADVPGIVELQARVAGLLQRWDR